MTRKETFKANSAEAREELLKGAIDVIKYKVCLATGKKTDMDLALMVDKVQEQVWDAVVPMIQKIQDREAIEAKTAQDIIGLLTRGKLSITEAKDLMSMMHDKADIDEAEELWSRVEEIEGKLKQEK